jgi:hemoglobin/transferrin/lactoferrin receptor protein
MNYFRHHGVIFTASLLALAVSQQAWGGDTSNGELHLPRQKLATSLLSVGQSTKTEVLFQPGDVENLEAPPLDGSYSAEAAVRALIKDSDLTIEIRNGSIILRGRTFRERKPPARR